MPQFIKGQSGNPKGRPYHATNGLRVKVHEMFEDAVRGLTTGDNPLTVMAEIMNDPSLLEIIDNPDENNFDRMNAIKMRLQAATELAKHIVPALPKELNVSVEHFDNPLTELEMIERLAEIKLEFEKRVISEQ